MAAARPPHGPPRTLCWSLAPSPEGDAHLPSGSLHLGSQPSQGACRDPQASEPPQGWPFSLSPRGSPCARRWAVSGGGPGTMACVCLCVCDKFSNKGLPGSLLVRLPPDTCLCTGFPSETPTTHGWWPVRLGLGLSVSVTPQLLPHVCSLGLAPGSPAPLGTWGPASTPVPSPQDGAGHVSLLLSPPCDTVHSPSGAPRPCPGSQARLWFAGCLLPRGARREGTQGRVQGCAPREGPHSDCGAALGCGAGLPIRLHLPGLASPGAPPSSPPSPLLRAGGRLGLGDPWPPAAAREGAQ